ncbi:argininosuccinate lyase-like protein [Xylophilus ampelinus]|uniref:Argininosuccinate lyase-like protein n=1 Tax=Xylophilus ampelinus TaxID=54067 RepID=A0A318SIK7_9BURK|nr:argininosuccinate lyase-like protein [Xylophilus ampelinus]
MLTRQYKLPLRAGHHLASEVVEYAEAENIRPLDFPYAEAQRIYAETARGSDFAQVLPVSEAEFRAALDPVAIVKNRQTAGGPQPAEMQRMVKEARQRIAQQEAWIQGDRARIASSLARLDGDFQKLGAAARRGPALRADGAGRPRPPQGTPARRASAFPDAPAAARRKLLPRRQPQGVRQLCYAGVLGCWLGTSRACDYAACSEYKSFEERKSSRPPIISSVVKSRNLISRI